MSSEPQAAARPIEHTDIRRASLLEALFGEVGLDRFLSEHWTREPLFLPAAARSLTDVVTWADLRFLLTHQRVPAHRVLVPDGEGLSLPLDRYTERIAGGRLLLRADDLLGLLQEGRSLLVQELEHHHPPARALADRLAFELGEPIHIGVFCSWPGQRVLPPHYDLHENLIIGLAGEKQWTLHRPPEPFPFEFDPAQEPPPSVALSTAIRRGDLLYIPRGCWHVARAADGAEPSMHLTISVRCRTVDHLLALAARQCAGLAELGRPLRLVRDPARGGIGHDEAELRELAGRLRDALVDRLSAPGFAAAFHRDAMARDRPTRSGGWTTVDRTAIDRPLDPDTVLERPADQRALLSAGAGGGLILSIWGRELAVPEALAPAVRHLLSTTRVPLRELLDRTPVEERAPLETLVGELVGAELVFAAAEPRGPTPSRRRS